MVHKHKNMRALPMHVAGVIQWITVAVKSRLMARPNPEPLYLRLGEAST